MPLDKLILNFSDETCPYSTWIIVKSWTIARFQPDYTALSLFLFSPWNFRLQMQTTLLLGFESWKKNDFDEWWKMNCSHAIVTFWQTVRSLPKPVDSGSHTCLFLSLFLFFFFRCLSVTKKSNFSSFIMQFDNWQLALNPHGKTNKMGLSN